MFKKLLNLSQQNNTYKNKNNFCRKTNNIVVRQVNDQIILFSVHFRSPKALAGQDLARRHLPGVRRRPNSSKPEQVQDRVRQVQV